MYNYNFCVKKLKESKKKLNKQLLQEHWLKNYHDYVQPQLLEHYDARVNAFIKRIEETPSKPQKLVENPQPNQNLPFKFALSSRSHTGKKITVKYFNNEQEAEYKGSIFRSQTYTPLNNHQFRQRDKSKQIKPKSTKNLIVYKRLKQQRKPASKLLHQQVKSKIGGPHTYRKGHKDNFSDAHSFYDDNISLRYSINSEMENIERQAMEYEQKMEIVQKKSHFKRLANLQVLVSDPRAKKSISDLLVKEGRIRTKVKTQKQQAETDMLKAIIDKGLKTEAL